MLDVVDMKYTICSACPYLGLKTIKMVIFREPNNELYVQNKISYL